MIMQMQQSIELGNVQAEEKLLAVLINLQLAPSTAISLGLTRDDFAWEHHSLIFDALMRVIDRGGVVDETVVIGEVDAAGLLDAIGGATVITRLANVDYNPNILSGYVEIVRDRSMRRRLMAGFETCSRLVHSEHDTKALLHSVQNVVYRVLDSYMSNAYSGISASDLEARWDTRHEHGSRIPYTWKSVQATLNGRARGDLTIWGLYTSDGKSTIALRNIVWAARQGLKCGFFLLEMTDEQITLRLLAYLTGIESGRIERDELSLDEKMACVEAFQEIEKWDLELYCDPSITVDDIRAIQMRERFDYIGIDYLQRFDFKDFSEIPRFAKKLKNLALTTKCCIDLFSQLTPKNINPGQNPYTKPDNQSLYGGKATAFEADNVFFLWSHRSKDEDGGWEHRTGYGTLIASKVRQGRPGAEFKMVFNANTIQWEEVT